MEIRKLSMVSSLVFLSTMYVFPETGGARDLDQWSVKPTMAASQIQPRVVAAHPRQGGW